MFAANRGYKSFYGRFDVFVPSCQTIHIPLAAFDTHLE